MIIAKRVGRIFEKLRHLLDYLNTPLLWATSQKNLSLRHFVIRFDGVYLLIHLLHSKLTVGRELCNDLMVCVSPNFVRDLIEKKYLAQRPKIKVKIDFQSSKLWKSIAWIIIDIVISGLHQNVQNSNCWYKKSVLFCLFT